MTHSDLIVRAAKWLKNTRGCKLVLTEPISVISPEIPDAIGWTARRCIVVEGKTSVSDFYADRRKAGGKVSGGARLGCQRYFLTERGVIKAHLVPLEWGLLEIHGKVIRVLVDRPPLPLLSHGEMRMRREISILLGCAIGKREEKDDAVEEGK